MRKPHWSEPNYPKNCWWVAARQNEVGRTPLSRWLLDLPVVMYRTEAGEVVALDNRCIHRWAPISTGYLEGDNIVCGYHGAVYAPNGKCVHYPTQATVPEAVKVRAYPVLERNPFVWIWLGEAAAREQTPEPPEFTWFSDPAWLTVEGTLPIAANYFMLQENVLDLTHLNYAHRRLFKGSDLLTPTFKREGDQVTLHLVQDPFTVPAIRKPGSTPGSRIPNIAHTLKREMLATFVSPALHTVDMPITDLQAGPGEKVRYESKVAHCVTPASPTQTHYWWIYGQDFGAGPGAAEAIKASTDRTFLEDKAIMEGIQATLSTDARGGDLPQVVFVGDKGSLQARRILQELLDKERASSPASASSPQGEVGPGV